MPRLSPVKRCTRSALAVREIYGRHGSIHEYGSFSLRETGHDALHLRDEGLQKMEDSDILVRVRRLLIE